MAPFNTNGIRPLTDDEIARLEKALGQPFPCTITCLQRA
jgi:hypothetical protein